MTRMRALVLVGTFAVLALLIFPVRARPLEIPLGLLPGTGPADSKSIASYPAAVDAILRVMVEKLRLPMPRGKLLVYETREEFEAALIEQLKIEPGLARSTAKFAKSAVGNLNVLVNEEAIAQSSWPERIELLAHELSHSLQLALAHRTSLARPQWLIEGSAEWLAYNIATALALDDVDLDRARLA